MKQASRFLSISLLLFGLALTLSRAQNGDSIPGSLISLQKADTSFVIVYPEYWVDSLGNWTLDSLPNHQPLQDLPDSRFQAKDRNHIIWARFHLASALSNPSRWYFIDNNQTDSLLIWQFDSTKLVQQYQTGGYVKGKDRPLMKYDIIAFPIQLAPGDSFTYYIRARELDSDFPSLSFRIVSQVSWLSINQEMALVFIVGFTAVLVFMAMYSFMVFSGIQDSTYLHYALYLLSIAGFLAFAGGPHALTFNPRLTEMFLYVALSGISIFYFLFARKFLSLDLHAPVWNKILLGYVWVRLALMGIQLGIIWFTRRIDWATQIEFSFFMIDALITLALYPRLIRMKKRIAWFFIMGSAVVFALALAYMGISIVILNESPNFQIFFVAVLIEILVFSLGLGFRVRETEQDKLAAEQALNAELSKINTAFGRFVPHEFIQSLGHKSVLDVQLGDGVEKEVAVLFSDIRGYTSLAEQMSPQENFRFLNAYLGRMGPVIKQAGGFVNQYYGDGVMALFIDNPQASLQAAMQMFEALKTYNTDREAASRAPIRMGIGLHIGNLMMGVIGDTLRMEAGVVSDTVNTASRMEGLTKHFHSSIILSQHVFNRLTPKQQELCRMAGRVRVKGRQAPLEIYECFAADPNPLRSVKINEKALFEAALEHYVSGRFIEAATQLGTLSKSDPLVPIYLKRAEKYIQEGSPTGWDGVEIVMQK